MVGVEKIVENVVKNYEVDDEEKVRKEVERVVKKFEELLVPVGDGRDVVRIVVRKLGLKRKPAEDTKLADVEVGQRVNVKVKVLGVAKPKHERSPYAVLVGDDTAKMTLIVFRNVVNAGVPVPEKGKSYRITELVVREGRNGPRLVATPSTELEELDEEVEVKVNEREAVAFVANVHESSGLIVRCNDCKRTIRNLNAPCPACGGKDFSDDLRLKVTAVIDGVPKTLVMNRDVTEKLTGITLEEAKNVAREALDRRAVKYRLEEAVLCRHLKVKFVEFPDNSPVTEATFATPEDVEVEVPEAPKETGEQSKEDAEGDEETEEVEDYDDVQYEEFDLNDIDFDAF